MEQLDLLGVFGSSSGDDAPLDRPALVERLTAVSARPRFAFFVLDLIAKASGASGSVGPYVVEDNQALPVRDWLCDAIIAVSGREPKRLAVAAQVRRDLDQRAVLPRDPGAAQAMIDSEVRGRLRQSGRSNISRAVSDLVRAGLVRRHYQGYAVDHHNRGAQRQAVYQVTELARRALADAA